MLPGYSCCHGNKKEIYVSIVHEQNAGKVNVYLIGTLHCAITLQLQWFVTCSNIHVPVTMATGDYEAQSTALQYVMLWCGLPSFYKSPAHAFHLQGARNARLRCGCRSRRRTLQLWPKKSNQRAESRLVPAPVALGLVLGTCMM